MTEGQRQLRTKGTQGHIARRVGVRQQTVSKWLMGTARPDHASRVTMKKEFGIELDAWDRAVMPPAPAPRKSA